ncbi:MAG TPA: hypothetical protein VIC55_06220 [Gemmatimonadaceae bacterium]|jgi:hypothetical protein
MIKIRQRLGLGIGQERVSAVLFVGETVRWVAARRRGEGVALSDSLRALLAECPRSQFMPMRVIAAVGPSTTQLKRVTDLPLLSAPRALAAVVREHAGRFFLKNGVPLVFTAAWVESPGCIWIAGFEEPDVTAIIAACRDARLPVSAIVPTAVALRCVVDESQITWADGDVSVKITYAERRLVQVRRIPSAGPAPGLPLFVESVASLGAQAAHVMDAAGAARTPSTEALALHTRHLDHRETPTRRRSTLVAVSCTVAISLAVLSPGIAASLVLRRAEARATVIGPRAAAAEKDARMLDSTSAVLDALAAFANSRRSMTLLLAEVTRALPDSSTLLALQIDSSGTGNIVAVASHAAAIVDAVERVPSFTSPEIVGPVTHESLGGHTVERVTVRFRVLAPEEP